QAIETVPVRARDGVRIGARCSGKTGRALVFVHGVGSTASIWDAQLGAFADDFRCAAVELRGNGVFENPDPSLITRATFAADVLDVCDALGFERFTLVGCSLGGVVGFELWQRASERMEAMAIVGSFARYPAAQRYASDVCAAVDKAGDMRRFALSRASKLNLPPARLAETIEQMACKSVACYLASTRATWTGDYRHVLRTIDVPLLVLCGERDAIAPFALSEEIASAVAGATLKVVNGAGHVANADAPTRFNELLRDFLSASVSIV
ncbi:MAG: alpha/beta fold hydrolase, partial [Candidatus Eremiobacteraeota bacterium]|nr:alpha/beta fold hydrolase [Candidatus Eremiobacteraeota bacterium]